MDYAGFKKFVMKLCLETAKDAGREESFTNERVENVGSLALAAAGMIIDG